jgi:alkaline phosphatase
MGSQATPAGSIQSTTDTTTPAATAATPAAELSAIQSRKQQQSLFQLWQPVPFH